MINLGPYSGKNCPNVRYQPGVIDRVLELAALLILLTIWGCVYWLYTQKGAFLSPDVWIAGGASALSLVLVEVCSYAPVRKINFPVCVNERNIGIQYLLVIRFIRAMNLILGLIFLSSVFMSYYELASIFFWIATILLFVAFAVYFVFAFKYK